MKLTNAQAWLIHTLELLALGLVFTTVATVYGAFQAGNFSLASAGVAVGTAVMAVLSKGVSGILANANTAQAVGDTVNELKQSHNVLIAQVSNLAGIMTNLLHLHSAQQAVLAQPVQPVQNSAPVTQQIQPQQGANPWGNNAGTSQASVPQVSFPTPINRDWTGLSVPVPSQQSGQPQ